MMRIFFALRALGNPPQTPRSAPRLARMGVQLLRCARYQTFAAFLICLPMVAQAEVCREYTRTIMIGGKAQEGVGTACQQEDGSWRTLSNGGEEEIAWNEPVRDRVIYVERERPIYVERPQPVSMFQLSFGDGYRGQQCHRRNRGWRGWDDDRGWHRGYRRGHGHRRWHD